MSEFKFRYYDPFNDCFSYSRNFDNLFEFFRQYQMAVDGGNEPILEQFTGLKDKNGAEIYECDILKAFKDHILEVECIKGAFGYHYDKKKEWFITFCNHQHLTYYHNWDCADFEIIGNIHQNPELIG